MRLKRPVVSGRIVLPWPASVGMGEGVERFGGGVVEPGAGVGLGLGAPGALGPLVEPGALAALVASGAPGALGAPGREGVDDPPPSPHPDIRRRESTTVASAPACRIAAPFKVVDLLQRQHRGRELFAERALVPPPLVRSAQPRRSPDRDRSVAHETHCYCDVVDRADVRGRRGGASAFGYTAARAVAVTRLYRQSTRKLVLSERSRNRRLARLRAGTRRGTTRRFQPRASALAHRPSLHRRQHPVQSRRSAHVRDRLSGTGAGVPAPRALPYGSLNRYVVNSPTRSKPMRS